MLFNVNNRFDMDQFEKNGTAVVLKNCGIKESSRSGHDILLGNGSGLEGSLDRMYEVSCSTEDKREDVITALEGISRVGK